ncbi:MAG: phage tail protein [Arsenophonus sp. NC-PG7-MAG3]
MQFHQQYCQLIQQWQQIQTACRTNQALAFVLGNDEYLEHFVINTLTGPHGVSACTVSPNAWRSISVCANLPVDLRQPLKSSEMPRY